MSTFYVLPAGDDESLRCTHLAVREDAYRVLYGFAREADRTLFRALLKVSGVGGKMALGVLSGMTAEFPRGAGRRLCRADAPAGVGKEDRRWLVVEMRDKIGWAGFGAEGWRGDRRHRFRGADQDGSARRTGILPPEASRMVSKVFDEGMIRRRSSGAAPRAR